MTKEKRLLSNQIKQGIEVKTKQNSLFIICNELFIFYCKFLDMQN